VLARPIVLMRVRFPAGNSRRSPTGVGLFCWRTRFARSVHEALVVAL